MDKLCYFEMSVNKNRELLDSYY